MGGCRLEHGHGIGPQQQQKKIMEVDRQIDDGPIDRSLDKSGRQNEKNSLIYLQSIQWKK